MSFQSMRHILTGVVKHHVRSDDLQVARVFEIATLVLRKLWGDERAQMVVLKSFHEGVLKFETTSAAAKQQLTVDGVRLKNEMNRQLGAAVIAQLRIESKGF
ncbi:DUF721 domain-containing protein [Patescibacteria group bacterium]|nr:DUF721 domain-containing protein [Patescibacteria group bacterium]